MVEKDYLKTSKVRMRGYFRVVDVNSLTHYLSVPKWVDMRMVYNGTSSCLNTSLCYPHFALPMVGFNIREVEKGTFMEDRDIV